MIRYIIRTLIQHIIKFQGNWIIQFIINNSDKPKDSPGQPRLIYFYSVLLTSVEQRVLKRSSAGDKSVLIPVTFYLAYHECFGDDAPISEFRLSAQYKQSSLAKAFVGEAKLSR